MGKPPGVALILHKVPVHRKACLEKHRQPPALANDRTQTPFVRVACRNFPTELSELSYILSRSGRCILEPKGKAAPQTDQVPSSKHQETAKADDIKKEAVGAIPLRQKQ